MNIGIIGKKRGMTRIFQEDGTSVPVTVVEASPNRIAQLKTLATDGYSAVQVTLGERKPAAVNKPLAGHYAKNQVSPGNGCWEFRVTDTADLEIGAELTVSQFEAGQKVFVTGVSKGKGFAGVIKRYNFSMQDATHGNSLSHRAPGSIGQCQTPGRVFKGKKMAGHMGSEKITVKNLEIVSVDADRALLLIKGAVPGSKGGHVVIRTAAQKN
ncbi:MAG: 50S ribosomal protein L3 [Gammaproteobacteria bacterium]|jgi:large subunit ribosomal protein L3|nr:50S ribosomal protein L3 [Gammaproteobacteria bacterium]